MNDRDLAPSSTALRGLTTCVVRSAWLLARGRVHLPRRNIGMRLKFANGTTAWVFRETVADHHVADPCVLVVEFRLRLVGGFGHVLFRWESILNTPLFVGFPGFVTKLWMSHDEHGTYRGVYEWDGADAARYYARCLIWLLALVCVPNSIRYHVLPGLRRDEFIARSAPAASAAMDATESWRVTGTT
jgi:hypothetical protein